MFDELNEIIVCKSDRFSKEKLYFEFSSGKFIDKADVIQILQELRSVIRLEKQTASAKIRKDIKDWF